MANTKEKLQRFNVMLDPAESQRVDRLADQILTRTGCRISRSAILRAGLSVLGELQRMAEAGLPGALPLDTAQSGRQLESLAVIAVRRVQIGGSGHAQRTAGARSWDRVRQARGADV